MAKSATMIAALIAFSGGAAWGQTWTEAGDAPDFPIGAYQETAGLGPLTAIDGSMAWDADNDHVDAFCITVTDPSTFFASVHPADGGYFNDDQGDRDDSRLYLFELDGTMVMANDDRPAGGWESYLSDPSTFFSPGGLSNNPGSVAADTQYILAVTYYANDLLDSGNVELATFIPYADLHGINPASTGVGASWENLGDTDASWDYRIALGGATYCRVPEPASATLLFGGLASVAGGAIRRRRRQA